MGALLTPSRALETTARAKIGRLESRLAGAAKTIEDAVLLYLTGRAEPDFNALLARYKELHLRVEEARNLIRPYDASEAPENQNPTRIKGNAHAPFHPSRIR
jgi:hypothetical protein